VILLTRLRLVDNSENAKRVKRTDQPYCIKLPKNSKLGKFGDIIKIAHLGKVYNAMIVSNRQMSKFLPRYDHHNIIMLNDKKEPVATRIRGPLPSKIRKNGEHSKVVAMATRFI
jgi:large subunit ribosomal protein L14